MGRFLKAHTMRSGSSRPDPEDRTRRPVPASTRKTLSECNEQVALTRMLFVSQLGCKYKIKTCFSLIEEESVCCSEGFCFLSAVRKDNVLVNCATLNTFGNAVL